MTVSDPNWRFPSLDLLENVQSPADAGDVQHNAKIIQDTLSEFEIDVKMEGANIGPRVNPVYFTAGQRCSLGQNFVTREKLGAGTWCG